MRVLKKVLFLFTIVFTFCAFTSNVNAQNEVDISAEDFDYAWYLSQHPDLAAIVNPTDYATIYNFYLTTGLPAGWNGRKTVYSLIKCPLYSFNPYDYVVRNPDLITAFGLNAILTSTENEITNARRYVNNVEQSNILNGKFNPENVYIDMNAKRGIYKKYFSDVNPALINEIVILYNHYLTQGLYELRYLDNDALVYLKVYELADSLTTPAMSTTQKIAAIHDWMLLNIAYDYDNYLNNTIPRESYSPYGAVILGKSVCQGYAEAFGLFMDALGIKWQLISSSSHAWNRVKVDGQWLSIDVTWDDPVPDRPGRVLYTYFLIPDAQMEQVRSHTPNTTYRYD